jgi:ABC-type antimicrobial peptide transport system permease subunit
MLNGVRLEVIGVARDTKYSRSLREKTPLEFYVPFFGGGVRMPPTFYARTEHSAAAIVAEIRRVVTRIEPQVTIRNLRTMDEVIDRLLVRERIIAQLVGFFSMVALLLASLGIYGLLSYTVAQRTREIGVRMALGATLRDVVRLVIRQGLTLALFGFALGVSAALMVTKFIATLLYGVQPADPFTFAVVTGLLVAVALTACWLPARRAASVDPMEALRYE